MIHKLQTYYDDAISRLPYRPINPLQMTMSATEISGNGVFDAGRLFDIPLRAEGSVDVEIIDGEISVEAYFSPYSVCDLDDGQHILAEDVTHTGYYDITSKQWEYTTQQL